MGIDYQNNLTASRLDGPTGYEPQRMNNGLLVVSIPGNVDDTFLQVALTTVKIPEQSNNVVPVKNLNEERKFAGTPVFGDISASMIDYIDLDVAQQLAGWRKLVYNPGNGKIGWKRTYAANGYIHLFGPNGQGDRSYRVIGIWPSAMDPGEIDRTSDDVLRVSVTFQVDKAFLLPTVQATVFDTSGVDVQSA